MKKKVLILVSIIALVLMLGMTTVFATSYNSTFTFKAGLTGATRYYELPGTDMCINCWDTSYTVPSGYHRTDTGAVTYDVQLYRFNQYLSVYQSCGTVTGFPMSSSTYNGRWVDTVTGDFYLDRFRFYFKAGNNNHTQKDTSPYTNDYVEITGSCTMYNE